MTEEYIADLEKLAKKIKIKVKDYKLFIEALTHRSFINEIKTKGVNHNERLEFLGDAVLELVVTEFLFNKYPKYPEGDLTSFRAALVKTDSLAEEALNLGIGQYLLMSKGEESTGGRTRPYILANTVESIIGFIYIDQGYEVAKTFIIKNICHKITTIVKYRLDIDSKSKLQEISQEITKFTPTYQLVNSEGPDHSKVFEMAVFIGEHKFAQAQGRSKQEAEQKAAGLAIKNWDNLYKRFFN